MRSSEVYTCVDFDPERMKAGKRRDRIPEGFKGFHFTVNLGGDELHNHGKPLH
jgi:hypothetical protein